MDAEVEGDGNPRDGGRANELGVAQDSGGAVVVAVEEGEGLLLEEEEARVEELEVLCQVVEVVEDNQGLGPAAIDIADGEEDALADDGGQELLNEESQEDAADGGEVEVVDKE